VEASYQWKLNGVNIEGATAPFYKPTGTGDYTVTAFSSGCSKESAAYHYVTDPLCELDTTTPVVRGNDVCGDTTVEITIAHSQSGVSYQAVNANADVLSMPESSSGGTVTLKLAASALDSGANVIQIKAVLEGCVDRILDSEARINYTPPFSINVPDTVKACEGSVATIEVDGVPQPGTYNWYDGSGQKIGGPQSVYGTAPVVAETAVYVTGVLPGGCESEKAKVIILPQIVPIPVIVLEAGVLLTKSVGTFQWKHDGEIITGATDASFTPLTSGSYTVIVFVDGCSKESSPYLVSITSIGVGNIGEFVLNTYPVPSTAANFRFSVRSPEPKQVTIEVVDITGRSVFKRSYNLNELQQGLPVDTGKGILKDGVYCVIATQGKSEIRKRIIIRN
jgi:hypothetical protein